MAEVVELQVVFAHGYELRDPNASELVRHLNTLTDSATRSLQTQFPFVRLVPLHASKAAVQALRDGEITCVAGVLDVTDLDEHIALFAGLLKGARIPCIVLCQEASSTHARELGLDKHSFITYKSKDDLLVEAAALSQEMVRAVSGPRVQAELTYRVWFPRGTSSIWVVCPQIHEPGQYATRTNPDYTYLDNLGDTDALLEVMVFLSQYYPNATIEKFSSVDLPPGHTSGNLVVIGGPGCPEDIGNELSRDMMSLIKSHISYSENCEHMIVTSYEKGPLALQAQFRSGVADASVEGEGLILRQDHGYFARFRNPLNENTSVVLINGIHTSGVLGAARVFGERVEALKNYQTVLSSDAELSGFECHFEVQVINGAVRVPTLSGNNVMRLKWEDQAAPPMTGAHEAAMEERQSARVLFIAGDRGGSQVSQVQIPREHKRIQDALRKSKHRKLIALTQPILGATRENLAEAYRERPTVIHFAGHGNDRRLSILMDSGTLVKEADLTAEQLVIMLKSMQDKIRLLVLNACGSEPLAREIVNDGAVGSAIGWPGKVPDSVAISFSACLYGALGDARTISDAYELASLACGPDHKPVLIKSAVEPEDASVLPLKVTE